MPAYTLLARYVEKSDLHGINGHGNEEKAALTSRIDSNNIDVSHNNNTYNDTVFYFN
ncbi:MAG: hypothetical protein ACK4PR_02210 [Gammaproteobacteria bacterium]